MLKQYIVVRKDLPMSLGKLSAQVSHASMAFVTHMLKNSLVGEIDKDYSFNLLIDKKMWNEWMNPEASFTKVVLASKNKNQMNRIVEKATEAGLLENSDFFCIRDEGRTELENYKDENGTIFTCIGFKPCEEEILKPILGNLQLYNK